MARPRKTEWQYAWSSHSMGKRDRDQHRRSGERVGTQGVSGLEKGVNTRDVCPSAIRSGGHMITLKKGNMSTSSHYQVICIICAFRICPLITP